MGCMTGLEPALAATTRRSTAIMLHTPCLSVRKTLLVSLSSLMPTVTLVLRLVRWQLTITVGAYKSQVVSMVILGISINVV